MVHQSHDLGLKKENKKILFLNHTQQLSHTLVTFHFKGMFFHSKMKSKSIKNTNANMTKRVPI